MAKKHPKNEWDNPMNYPSKGRIEQAGHEMKRNPPAILAHTESRFGKARSKKQKIKIMLEKAGKNK